MKASNSTTNGLYTEIVGWLATVVLHSAMFLLVLGFIAMLAVISGRISLYSFKGLRRATITAPWSSLVERRQQPMIYWTIIAASCALAAFFAWFATLTMFWVVSPYHIA